MIVGGTNGTKPDTLSEALLIMYDREGAEKSHGLVEPDQPSRYPCRCFKEARTGDWRMVSRGRGFQKLETRFGNVTLAFRRR